MLKFLNLEIIKTTEARVKENKLKPRTFFSYISKTGENFGQYLSTNISHIFHNNMQSFSEFLKSDNRELLMDICLEDLVNSTASTGTPYCRVLATTANAKFVAFYWGVEKLEKGKNYSVSLVKSFYNKNNKTYLSLRLEDVVPVTDRIVQKSRPLLGINLDPGHFSNDVEEFALANVSEVLAPELLLRKVRTYPTQNTQQRLSILELVDYAPLTAIYTEWVDSFALSEPPVFEAVNDSQLRCKNVTLSWYYRETTKEYVLKLAANPFTKVQLVSK